MRSAKVCADSFRALAGEVYLSIDFAFYSAAVFRNKA
jgi:hypothetical protein